MSDEVISVHRLRKSFHGKPALAGIDLQVKKGEIFGLVGPDGAGKTTLIRILAGILNFESGKVKIMGFDLDKNRERIRNKVGYVSQRFSLYKDLTVGENVNFFSQLYPRREKRKWTGDQLLEMVNLLPFTNRLADNLSGGMKQKLALVCSLIHNPNLLLMDEPTTGVDPVSRREFWQIIFNLQKQGLTVLSSTPYMDEAEQFDRVALIHNGKFFRCGSVEKIKKSVPGKVIEIVCDRPIEARKLLRELDWVKDANFFGDKIHLLADQAEPEKTGQLKGFLEDRGICADNVQLVSYSIEDVFLKVAHGGN